MASSGDWGPFAELQIVQHSHSPRLPIHPGREDLPYSYCSSYTSYTEGRGEDLPSWGPSPQGSRDHPDRQRLPGQRLHRTHRGHVLRIERHRGVRDRARKSGSRSLAQHHGAILGFLQSLQLTPERGRFGLSLCAWNCCSLQGHRQARAKPMTPHTVSLLAVSLASWGCEGSCQHRAPCTLAVARLPDACAIGT